MATLRQTCEALDGILRLPPSAARGHAQRLRAAGYLPTSQGYPGQISSEHIAAVLIAIAVGSPVITDYINMRSGNGGPTFGKVLAGFVEKPNDVLEVVVDTLAPGASVTFRGADHGVQTIAFYPPSPKPRPAFDRDVRLGPEILIRLHAAIATAPEVRAGRPRLRDRFTRIS
ncbi:hypothetical protein [Rhizobium sp. CCGE 510]|uniref:hypothetical protein n=1 Tax=Rhizobium sp. CCGE 510 TaxID=1132836 RepID=UPI00027B7E2F|nr:hypothetical protein [Rhizobium sp. CCGE 510]EJT05697.1 hypothetical protein RCCGE510_07211 [Rhizobium sp. CCGE 510]